MAQEVEIGMNEARKNSGKDGIEEKKVVSAFLDFLNKQVQANPLLVQPADIAQLKRISLLLGRLDFPNSTGLVKSKGKQ